MYTQGEIQNSKKNYLSKQEAQSGKMMRTGCPSQEHGTTGETEDLCFFYL